MKFAQLFKLHFYSYYLWYLIFIIATFLGLGSVLIFFKDNSEAFTTFMTIYLIVGVIITIFMGIYEFNNLCYTYLNLKISRSSFYISSIIHSLINALIITIIFVILEVFSKYIVISPNEFSEFSSVVLTMFINVLFYLLGAVATLLLHNVKYIKFVIYVALLIVLSVFGREIKDFLFTSLVSLYQEVDKLIVYLPIISGSTIILMLIEYLCFKQMDITK